jgi:monofunctional biosynthetic peptidoglycan transglycosylase
MSETPALTRRRKAPLRRLALIVVLAILLPVIAVHLYALALSAMPVPGTILMSQRAGQGQEVRQDWRPLEQISPHLVHAVIAAEDARFCEHDGIDWDAVEAAREWNRNNPDRPRRGGSSISQQTAKNVFFWNGGGMARKAGEAWMTLVIERVWGKRRIMETYLNVAEWGDGLFGAEAAAQARFGKSAAELSEREAALLAAVLPSPNRWRAVNPGPYVQRRAGTIQSRMRVVAAEGFAACVLTDEDRARLPRPPRPPGEAPPPRPVLPDLPDAPETGEEALGPEPDRARDPDPEAEAALMDFLDETEAALGAIGRDERTGESLPEVPEAETPDSEVGDGPEADIALSNDTAPEPED